METLIYAFNAVTPLLLLIALGYVLKRVFNFREQFFSELNNFCYRILLPVQLFYNVYQVESLNALNWKLLLYVALWVPVAIIIGILLSFVLIKDRRQKGAFVQACFRSNQAIMGLPLAASLGGAEAAAIASVATSIGIPLFNISAVIVLRSFSTEKGERVKGKDILKSLVTNPLLIGVFSGILIVAIRYFIPTEAGVPIFTIENQLSGLYTAIRNISGVASPVMLICLGAGLKLSFTRSLVAKIAAGVSMRLIIIPALAIGIALLFRDQLGVATIHMPMLVAFFASPVAVSSAILVRELGGDDQYASQLVIWSSVFSMVTLFAFIAVLRNFGFL